VKEYCPNTCAHTRTKGDCSNGNGVQRQKCLDGEWIDDICLIVGTPLDDPTNHPTNHPTGASVAESDEPTYHPTGAPVTSAPITDAPTIKKTDAPVTSAPITDAPITDAPTIKKTDQPTNYPTEAAASKKSAIKRTLLDVVSEDVLSDPTSSEYNAFTWIADKDELSLSPDDDSLVQRYVLALIYFGMDGTNWDRNKIGEKYLTGTSECDWYGVFCHDDFDNSIMFLKLDDINLSGTIPNAIGELNKLKELQMESNSIFGSIPNSIGDLSLLTKLSLDGNLLTSTLPDGIFNLRNLEWLDVDTNQLTGTISPRIGELSSLTILSLFECQFSGTIPLELGLLSNVTEISLDGNDLDGEVPQELCDLRDDNLYFLAVDCGVNEDGSPPKVNCEKKSQSKQLECCVCSV